MTGFDPATDWTPPDESESAAIRDYFDRRDDRALVDAPNPLFTGRGHLIEAVADDIRALRAAKRPLNNLTRVIYGAPGAGKSEVLIQMAAEFSRWDEGDSPVLVVWGGQDSLADPVSLEEDIYEAAGRDPYKLAREPARVEYGASVKIASVKATRERRADRPATLRRTARAINRKFHNPTILLLVDEAQKKLHLARDGGTPLALHLGEAGMKILPVYGGLGDTRRRLRECGASRLSAKRVHLLEPLDRGDARKMSKTGLCALTGTSDPVTLERWARRAVKKADGWPMHLANCMIAARDRRKERMNRRFDDAGFDQAMRDADALCSDYYDARLQECGELKRSQYTAWAALFGQDGDIWPETVRTHPVLGADRGEGQGDLVEGAVRAGLVELKTDGTLQSPIPSLVNHIARRGRRFERSLGRSQGSNFER